MSELYYDPSRHEVSESLAALSRALRDAGQEGALDFQMAADDVRVFEAEYSAGAGALARIGTVADALASGMRALCEDGEASEVWAAYKDLAHLAEGADRDWRNPPPESYDAVAVMAAFSEIGREAARCLYGQETQGVSRGAGTVETSPGVTHRTHDVRDDVVTRVERGGLWEALERALVAVVSKGAGTPSADDLSAAMDAATPDGSRLTDQILYLYRAALAFGRDETVARIARVVNALHRQRTAPTPKTVSDELLIARGTDERFRDLVAGFAELYELGFQAAADETAPPTSPLSRSPFAAEVAAALGLERPEVASEREIVFVAKTNTRQRQILEQLAEGVKAAMRQPKDRAVALRANCPPGSSWDGEHGVVVNALVELAELAERADLRAKNAEAETARFAAADAESASLPWSVVRDLTACTPDDTRPSIRDFVFVVQTPLGVMAATTDGVKILYVPVSDAQPRGTYYSAAMGEDAGKRVPANRDESVGKDVIERVSRHLVADVERLATVPFDEVKAAATFAKPDRKSGRPQTVTFYEPDADSGAVLQICASDRGISVPVKPRLPVAFAEVGHEPGIALNGKYFMEAAAHVCAATKTKALRVRAAPADHVWQVMAEAPIGPVWQICEMRDDYASAAAKAAAAEPAANEEGETTP